MKTMDRTTCDVISMAAQIGAAALLLLATPGECFPDGAPPSRCTDMKPGHGAAQINNPYTLSIEGGVTEYQPATKITVKVTGGGGFKGFLMLAQQAGVAGRQIVGTWDDLDVRLTGSKRISCNGGIYNAVTHASETPKNDKIKYVWEPPSGDVGTVEFIATILSTKLTYWMNTKSAQLTFKVAGSTPTPTPLPEGGAGWQNETTGTAEPGVGGAPGCNHCDILLIMMSFLALLTSLVNASAV